MTPYNSSEAASGSKRPRTSERHQSRIAPALKGSSAASLSEKDAKDQLNALDTLLKKQLGERQKLLDSQLPQQSQTLSFQEQMEHQLKQLITEQNRQLKIQQNQQKKQEETHKAQQKELLDRGLRDYASTRPTIQQSLLELIQNEKRNKLQQQQGAEQQQLHQQLEQRMQLQLQQRPTQQLQAQLQAQLQTQLARQQNKHQQETKQLAEHQENETFTKQEEWKVQMGGAQKPKRLIDMTLDETRALTPKERAEILDKLQTEKKK